MSRLLPGSDARLVLFAGRAELPLELPAQAGAYRLTYPDLEGGPLTLDVHAR